MLVGMRIVALQTNDLRNYPKAPGSQQWTPPGVDLDHGTKRRPVAFKNRQSTRCHWMSGAKPESWRGMERTESLSGPACRATSLRFSQGVRFPLWSFEVSNLVLMLLVEICRG